MEIMVLLLGLERMGVEINTCKMQWDNRNKRRNVYNIHKSVKEEVGSWNCRREEIIWSKLRFGHTGLNSSLKLIGTLKHETGLCD